MFDEKFKARVWAGDVTTVEEFRKTYDPRDDSDVLDMASLLYSFRYTCKYHGELFGFIPKLLDIAERYPATPPNDGEETWVRHADMLTTYLSWALRTELIWIESDIEQLVFRICGNVRSHYYDANICCSEQHLSLQLVRLTYAELRIWKNKQLGLKASDDEVRLALERTVAQAEAIEDANQRARILRKAAMLYRQIGMLNWPLAIVLGLRACTVPQSTWNTKFKSAAAMVGITK